MISILFIFSLMAAEAAPIPATSSSMLIGADVGRFISEFGFSMDAGGTSWIHSEPPKDMPAINTLYRSPKMGHGVQAALTVRVDRLKENSPLQKYVRQWMKDYPRLGFEVLASKPLKISGQNAHLLDIISRESNKQLRQVVFMKDTTAVVLTCRDHRDSFETTVKECNDIIRTFRWK